MQMTLDEFRLRLPETARGKPLVAMKETDCRGCDAAILPGDVVLQSPDKVLFCARCAVGED